MIEGRLFEYIIMIGTAENNQLRRIRLEYYEIVLKFVEQSTNWNSSD